jgi:hypothetical protein
VLREVELIGSQCVMGACYPTGTTIYISATLTNNRHNK